MFDVTLFLAAALLCITIYFIIASRFIKMPVLFAFGMFLAAACAYFFFENDFLLAVCMTAVYFLIRSFRSSKFPRKVTEIVVLCSVYICAVMNQFFPSPRITDITALLFLSFACYDAVRSQCKEFCRIVRAALVLWSCAFAVYAITKIAEIQTPVAMNTILLAVSLVCAAVCMFGLPLFFNDKFQKREKKLIAFFTGNSSLTAEKMMTADSVSGSAVRALLERILVPVEQIQNTAVQMKGGKTDIAADSRFILGKVNEIKACTGQELSTMLSSPAAQSSVAVEIPQITEHSSGGKKLFSGKVCVFEDRTPTVSISAMLSAAGADCILVHEEGELLRMLDKKEISLLIVEPYVTGTRSFDLCRRIRSTESMLSFPILMVVSYFENGVIQRAYETGVNDFIIRPFDASELVLRVSFLLQLSDLYREKEAIALSEKEKKTFLYFVTHNVNTPLALLENRIDELVQDCQSNIPVDNLVLDDIQESTGEIHDIIQNVLISFRISDGRYINSVQNIHISELFEMIKEPAEIKARLKGQRISWIDGDNLPPVACNDNALRGILTNLIDNAVKFSPVGTGIIEVCARRNSEDSVLISVTDNGPGIPPEKRSVLFNRFSDRGTVSTGAEKSNGLGLYVAYELAEMNGIVISYSDAPGGGACFSLSFLQNKKHR